MSLETPEEIRTLQRKLYCKAKAEPAFRFYLLYDKICRAEMNRFLKHWRFTGCGEAFRAQIIAYADDFVILSCGHAAEAMMWTKAVMTKLGLSLNEAKTSIRDARKERFEFLGYSFGPHYWWKNGQQADFQPGSFGYRPKRTAHEAVDRVAKAIVQHKTRVIDIDLRSYFDNVRHDRLLAKVARRVDDPDVMHLLKIMLKANGRCGVPQGGVISPLLSNLYLTEVDRMLERAKETTRYGKYTYIEYARFADDLVILIDAYPRHDWMMGAVEKRLREELADLQVEINEEKSRIVDLGRGESFGFLGFDFRRIRSRRGAWRANYTPKLKKRTALLRKLKDVFRRYQSQPVDRVVQLINPMLRGWVNYFAVGHSSECFSFIKDWVEKKIRRHMLRARKRKGFGWTRWSRQWLYETLRLFNGYRVRRPGPKVAPAG